MITPYELWFDVEERLKRKAQLPSQAVGFFDLIYIP